MRRIFFLLLVTSLAMVCFGQYPADPVAFYPFNGNANDESGNALHGVVYGATLTTDRFGNMNSAYNFQSKDDYITVNYGAIKLLNTSFTISAWVKIDSYPTSIGHFIRKGNHANYILSVTENNADFLYSSDPPPLYDPHRVRGNKVINLNEWTLITAVYDRALGMTKLYVNGVLDGTNPNAMDPHNPTENPSLEIGNWYGTRNSWNYPVFTGDLDDILIYKRALTDGEILGLYDITSTKGLVLWNELGSNEQVLNSTIGPNLEFYTGGSWPDVQGDREYVAGYNGNGVTLKGTYNSQDRIHNIVLNNLSNYIDPEKGCIELWYYQTEAPVAYQYGIYRLFDGSYGLGGGIDFEVGTTGVGIPAYITFGISFGGANCYVQYANANIPNNEWVHLAASWDRNGIDGTTEVIRLYVNNVVVATTNNNNWGTTVGQRVDICGGNDAYVSGKFKMDELKIWNYAKTNFFGNPPIVTTTAVSSITATSASGGGNVTSDGGVSVTARGVCWSTSPNPTISDSHTADGTGTGTFTSTITGLTPNTAYYVRAYTTNGAGIGYGDEFTFTALANPTISGTVTDGTNPIAGVTITFSHDGHTETTDANGHYSYTVIYGTTTTVKPSKTGYSSWNPANKTFSNIISNQTQNFSALLNTYTISGTVTDGTNPIAGVTITFSHDGHTETTDSNGNYSYTVAYGTSTTVTASKPGYTFEPSKYRYTKLTEDKPNQDFTVPNFVSVTITNPQDGGTVSGEVIINAEVSSQDASTAYASIQSVIKVEFYIDGVLVKKDTGSPYKHRWDTTLVSNGIYSIKAKAYHSSGLANQHKISVNVNNSTEPSHIELNRNRLNFGAVIGESQTGSQTFLISNSGGCCLDWTASVSNTWIKASPLSGTANMLVTVSVDVTGLLAGSYTGTVTIIDANADNSPALVDIYLEVKEKAQEIPVFGTFDSPKHGASICSVVPITGWALDDIEVSDVKIFRSPVPGQETGLIYIGDAVFVEGARPDVEGKNPEYPKHYQAGWGYQMLTNFLPNGGNGTFVITAVATDSSGNEVTLGSKTFTCDNANAVKPFGAIDTPFQGGDASGTDFVNFGWVLTPLPNTIPTDGSTIKVWVDGAPLAGNPVYNRYRKDIATLFPGYNNSDGAVGYYYLDTTLYANGIHTISWSVTDDAGNTDGVGSRYFRIMNVENPSAASTAALGYLDNLSIQDLPVSRAPVYLDKGYKIGIERKHHKQTLYPDNEEIITIVIKEEERIEIGLKDTNEIAGSMVQGAGSINTNQWTGFHVIGDEAKPLPIGSFLDVLNGIFYWQPGPGFIGEYKFVFIEKVQGGEFRKKMINVVIEPKF